MKKVYKRKIFFLLLVFTAVLSMFRTKVSAEEYDSGPMKVIYDYIGHYALNYTGNTNHYDYWNAAGTDKIVSRNYRDRTDISTQNNSSAVISKTEKKSTIKAAYLIWQSRSADAPATKIGIITPTGAKGSYAAQWVCQDTRTNAAGEEYVGVYTMAADVTDIVCSEKGGYGTYTVANIPVWEGAKDGIACGGESVASWQLVVVEESPNFPLRTVSLNILSQYFFNVNYTVTVNFSDASSPNGDVTAQFLDGSIDVDADYRYDGMGYPDDYQYEQEGQLYRYFTQARGLYKNGVCFNNRDTGQAGFHGAAAVGGTRVHLFDDSRRLNGQLSQSMVYLWKDKNMGINVFLYGVAIDLFAYDIVLDGNGADAGSMETMSCIYGRGYNLASNKYTKQNYQFAGWNSKEDGSGTWYRNEAYVRNLTETEDTVTLYAQWVPNTYRISLDSQDAGVGGTKAYYEWYGVGNYTTSACKKKISQIVLPEKNGYVFDGYYSKKNGSGTQYIDKTGKILSTATAFRQDTILYAKWVPEVYKITLDNQGADTAGTKQYYEKFGVGNYTSKSCTTAITQIKKPVKSHAVFQGYYTKKDGEGSRIIDASGKIVSLYTLFNQDTTLYAYWQPVTYKISLDAQEAVNIGSPEFYEKYGAYNYVTINQINTALGTTTKKFDYTGEEQIFIAPYSGTYHFEAVGAGSDGGSHAAVGGGCVTGDMELKAGDVLYIYVGGKGSAASAGWNGGGAPAVMHHSTAWGNDYNYAVTGGSGATDIRYRGNTINHRVLAGSGASGYVYCIETGENKQPNYGGTEKQDFDFYAVGTIDISAFGGNIYGIVTEDEEIATVTKDHSFSFYEGQTFTIELMPGNSVTQTCKQSYSGTLGTAGIGGGGGWYGGGSAVFYQGNFYESGASQYWYLIGTIAGSSSYTDGITNGKTYLYTEKEAYNNAGKNGFAVISYTSYGTETCITNSIEIPKKTGYRFGGYYTKKNGAGTQYVDESGNILSAPTTFTKDTTLYAYWIPQNFHYKVAFNGNGADSGKMNLMTCVQNTEYTLNKNAFQKTGYQFIGWSLTPSGAVAYGDCGKIYNLSTTMNDTVTLYAQWKPGKTSYKVNRYTENLNGNYTLYDTKEKNGTTGETILAASFAAQINGFTYQYAKVKGSETENAVIAADGSLVLNLYYSRNSYQLTLEKDKGIASVTGAGTYKYEEIVSINADVLRGYSWQRWSGAYRFTEEEASFAMPAEHIVLKANTSPKIYTIYLENQQAQTAGTLAYYEKYGVGNYGDYNCFSKITMIQLPKKSGYLFNGYYRKENGAGMRYIASNGRILSTAASFTEDTVLYAYWKPIAYTVHFDGNGADSGRMSDMLCSYEEIYSLPKNQFVKTGNSFAGWNTKPDGSGSTYMDKAQVQKLCSRQDEIITLYAQWASDIYRVAFDANGGDGTMEGMSCAFFKDYILPENLFTKTGNIFAGWSLTPDGAVSYADKAVINNLSNGKGSVTLYAQWNPAVYTVTLENQNAQTAGSKAYYEKYGVGNYAERACIRVLRFITLPQKTGYLFGGYYEQTGGKGTAYIDENGIILAAEDTFTEDTVLYAYWKPITYWIHFDGNGADSGNMSDMNCMYDKSYQLLQNQFTKEGYKFVGWNTNADGSGISYADLAAVKNLTDSWEETVILYAQWTEAAYTVQFDANGGIGSMEEIVLYYDTLQKLPKNLFTKHNAYGASRFLGWNTQPDATAALYEDEMEVVNLLGSESGLVTLFAVWDDCPWILAEDLYYTLYEAQNGLISYEELMSKAVAEDKEDGSPILPGTDNKKGTSFTLLDYQPTDFTEFTGNGSVTETYYVTDSAGNAYRKMITVHIIDTAAEVVEPKGTTRFLSEKYYKEDYENGGLEADSIWKTDAQYRAVLWQAFENSRNDTPLMTFCFSYEEVLKMKKFILENGFGNTKRIDALQRFYEEFMLQGIKN